MPTRRQHRAAAARHLLAYRFNVQRFPGWSATMLFYAALHISEAVFEQEGQHCTNHGDRARYIKERHKPLWSSYHRLQNESEKARYLEGGAFLLTPSQVEHELRKGQLTKIRKYLRELLLPTRRNS
jgi:hypothetical protein